ncbi:MAG: GTP-binding protein [Alphaproteobacteria bacterium]|nr:GTP-binding protein [Alphaproteobacteria bacterium]
MTATAPLPVALLTGFLGSGKTTVLNRLLRHPGMADTAVIINEFGEIGLDHLLVEKGEENVALLDSGCLCCTVANTLGETLSDIFFRRTRREVPEFARVLIETTGLADPAPILHTLMTDYAVTKWYGLSGVITVVDTVHGLEQLDSHAEAAKQAALAECLLLSKTDLAAPDRVAALRRRLAAMNPSARMIEAVHGAVDPAVIRATGVFDAVGKTRDLARWLGEPPNHDDHGHGDHDHEDHAHDGPHAHHSSDIATVSAYLDQPVTWPGYAAWLETLRRFEGKKLLRVKGLIAIEDPARPHVIHGVQHVFSPPARLPAWPSEDRRGRIVIIAQGIDAAALTAALDILRGS